MSINEIQYYLKNLPASQMAEVLETMQQSTARLANWFTQTEEPQTAKLWEQAGAGMGQAISALKEVKSCAYGAGAAGRFGWEAGDVR